MMRHIRLIGVALTLATLTGCTSWEREQDLAKNHPLVSPGVEAQAALRTGYTFPFLGIKYQMDWLSPSQPKWNRDAKQVLKEAVKFLGGVDALMPSYAKMNLDGRLDGRWHQQPEFQQLLPLAESNPFSVQYGLPVPQTRAIISIDPVIILLIDVPIMSHVPSDNRTLRLHATHNYQSDPRGMMIELPLGFTYGTSAPWSPTTKWCSPTLNIAPTDLTMNEQGVGEIEVQWGTILLTREDIRWVITTTAPSSAQRAGRK